jgi:hypothetical protein
MSASDSHKALGNAAFSAGRYEDAVRHFSDAIAVDAGNHVLYSNRSAAQVRRLRRKEARGESRGFFRDTFRRRSAPSAETPSPNARSTALTCARGARRRR